MDSEILRYLAEVIVSTQYVEALSTPCFGTWAPGVVYQTRQVDQALSFLRDRRPLGDTVEADELLLQALPWVVLVNCYGTCGNCNLSCSEGPEKAFWSLEQEPPASPGRWPSEILAFLWYARKRSPLHESRPSFLVAQRLRLYAKGL